MTKIPIADGTEILWTDYTHNPWIGCARVSPGCQHCYAEQMANRWGWAVWGTNGTRKVTSDANWRKPLKWDRLAAAEGVRRRVFCASLADVFELHRDLDEPRERLWKLIAETPNLDWLLLTKRPQNVRGMVPPDWMTTWPRNVWMGVTVEDQQRAEERIPLLIGIPAPVRFLSCEPLLGPVDLWKWGGVEEHPPCAECDDCGSIPVYNDDPLATSGTVTGYAACECQYAPDRLLIDWVISGGESGREARMSHPSWHRALRDWCRKEGAAYLFKQWGEFRPMTAREVPYKGGTPPIVAADPSRQSEAASSCFHMEHQLRAKITDPHYGAFMPMVRAGKHAAGRELDGRVWEQFPKVSTAVTN